MKRDKSENALPLTRILPTLAVSLRDDAAI